MTAKPRHSSKYSDPNRRRETADKISTSIESTPDCRGLAITITWDLYNQKGISKFLSSAACRFALYNSTSLRSLFLRSTMESVHLVKELKQRPIVVVTSGEYLNHHYKIYTNQGDIDIHNDIVKPLFSPDTPQLADNPKVFLFIVSHGLMFDYSSIQTIFSASGSNYIVGVIVSDDNAYSLTPTILSALESPQKSVQEIFESLKCEIDRPPSVHMIVIDHLNEPVYLHPDAPQGIYSGPGKPQPLQNTFPTLPHYRTLQKAARCTARGRLFTTQET